MARLLFLGASVSQVPAIRYAKDHGHFVVACDADPGAVAFSVCDVAEVVSFVDVDRVTSVAIRESVEGILAVCTDRAVVPAAIVAQRLGLPGLNPDVAEAMTHKPTMRARLAASNVAQPAHVVLTRDSDPAAVAPSLLPAVLKPADSGGQRGVFRVDTLDQLAAALPDALEQSRTGQAIFERYIEGDEVNTLFVVRGGVPTLLTISDRLRPPGPGFGVGWIHLFPSSLTADQQSDVEETASAAIRSLGMRDGIAFPQLLVRDEQAMIVEVAARIAAGQMSDLVKHATGIELYEIAIRQALGLEVPDSFLEPATTRPVAIRFLTASPGVLPVGTVRSISGLDSVRAAPGVLDADLYFGPGTTIAPVRVDADRRGYVIATGATAIDALERANSASRRLRVTTEEAADEPVAAPIERQRSRAARSLLAPILCAALLVGTLAAFLLTEHAKLQHALIAGTRVDKTFSPICRCPQNVAHIAFRLLRRTTIGVRIVSSSGSSVATLLRSRKLDGGLIHLIWNGRDRKYTPLPDGRYFPEVILSSLGRTLKLPSPILLKTSKPHVIIATASGPGSKLKVEYRFSEPAHALLLVNGKRAVLTRRAPEAGVVRFDGRFDSGERLRRAPRTLALVAIDLAGNRSRPYQVRP